MWTGDVQSGYSTQWALNPSVYQNMPHEQVDWATLAQQWIKMKETFPVDQVPPAPPPPSIKADIEAGEAPMDVSKDEISPSASASTSQDGSNWGSWNNWQQWNSWGWSGSSANSTSVPPDKPVPPPPYPYPAPAAPSSYTADIATPTTFDYNHGATIPDNFDQQGYWSGGPTPFVRNKSSDWRSDNRIAPGRRVSTKVEELEPDPNTFLDAAKRKQLPAWIREGLEKMDREKQKKLERERQLKEREEEMAKKRLEEEEAIASGIPVKSKFDSDSEESEKELDELPIKPRKSRFDATSASPVLQKPIVAPSPPPVKRKSREELMQEVMQKVRHVLTEILMSVTNEEMRRIGEEVLFDFRAKAPATQLRKTPALTSLTGKLGLGIYDSDSQDSSESEEEQPPNKKDPRVDSDEELRDRINRKKQEFARIEQDIEHQVELQKEKDREREKNIQEEEEEEDLPEENLDKAQVEQKLAYSGPRLDLKIEEHKDTIIKHEQNNSGFFTPEKLSKIVQKPKESSEEDESDDTDGSSSKSDTSSSSSSSSDHRSYRKSSKKRKEKKPIKRKRKRSTSRSSDRRKSSRKKSSHKYESKHKYRSRSRSRSRSRGYDNYRHKRSRSPSYRRHSSESSYKHSRRRHSYSRSPDYSRGKKSSHRSRD